VAVQNVGGFGGWQDPPDWFSLSMLAHD